ncbi:pyrroline-5-carboxylate reductase [Pumilibacter muris]|uniref:pyrroline-5-carboxylate reductase n=1 Tax=Pumilibacter muris TaxID=2941510 RepID=UPI00204014A7|nr:pyrroline-5-carboxylate reductase [Pumilibacter muris]
MKNYNLAVLGYGNMAQAIVKALCLPETQEKFKNKNINLSITITDSDKTKLDNCTLNVGKTAAPEAAVENAEFVLLAVKPQNAPSLLNNLSLSGKTVISIMAGTSIATLKELTRSNKIVRVMPNLNARVSASYNAYSCLNINSDEKEFISLLLNSFGAVSEVEEEKLDAVTGLTGSSPAFVFMLVKAFADKAVSCGFSPSEARKMAVTAVAGSAKLIESETNTELNDLIDSVCSKGGTTIEGVKYLRENNFETTLQTAVEKSINRAKELSERK